MKPQCKIVLKNKLLHNYFTIKKEIFILRETIFKFNDFLNRG